VFYLNCAKERVTRHHLIPNVAMGNITLRHMQHVAQSYESSEPALDYGMNSPGFKSQKGQEVFFLPKNVHVTSGTHPATCSTGAGVLSQGIKLNIHSI
jgi:hypothetical protein